MFEVELEPARLDLLGYGLYLLHFFIRTFSAYPW